MSYPTKIKWIAGLSVDLDGNVTRYRHKDINPMNKPVFVFGSNEGGIHGGGAARTAYEKHGARMQHSYGYSSMKKGNTLLHSFAIPTKNQDTTKTLSIRRINGYVQGFISFAWGHPEMRFDITRIGCGLAGLKDEHMAAMFDGACPGNCYFDSEWAKYLAPGHNYWGTF